MGTESDDGLTAASIVWWYFFSKFTDFMDSFFFVLRKKNNQPTSLHVIHHAMMPMVSWIFLKFVGGGHSTFFMFLNMGVHVVMYFYYHVLHGTGGAEVPLVEEVHHQHAVAPVCHILNPRKLATLHRLQLPHTCCVLHTLPWSSLLQPLH